MMGEGRRMGREGCKGEWDKRTIGRRESEPKRGRGGLT
jgi:hypothetical protein